MNDPHGQICPRSAIVAQQLKLPKGSLTLMDRGYNDYRLFERWASEGVGFITRLKKNAMWASHEERPVEPGGKIRRDIVGGFMPGVSHAWGQSPQRHMIHAWGQSPQRHMIHAWGQSPQRHIASRISPWILKF